MFCFAAVGEKAERQRPMPAVRLFNYTTNRRIERIGAAADSRFAMKKHGIAALCVIQATVRCARARR